MRVRRASNGSDGWFQDGADYPVVELIVVYDKPSQLRVDFGHGSNALVSASEVVLTSGRIPSNWTIEMAGAGRIEIGPSTFRIGGFWDAYFDDDDEARAAYQRELNIIVAEG
jgi:hypothetical protein